MFKYVRCAAVLCVDGECHYTDGPPAQALVDSFTKRCDNQITTLEILAISVGLSTFCDRLAGRNVIVYSDNTGAEVSLLLYLWCCGLEIWFDRHRYEKGHPAPGTNARSFMRYGHWWAHILLYIATVVSFHAGIRHCRRICTCGSRGSHLMTMCRMHHRESVIFS